MSQLARIIPAAAVACPHCQNRLEDLPLDNIACGVVYDCPYCQQPLRIPAPILERLLDQRDAAYREYLERTSPVERFFDSLIAAWRSFWS